MKESSFQGTFSKKTGKSGLLQNSIRFPGAPAELEQGD